MNTWTLFSLFCVAIFLTGLAIYKFMPDEK